MPDPAERKMRQGAQDRVVNKYMSVKSEEHPHNLNPPIKATTEAMRTLLTSKNYIRIMTQIDLCMYIMQQHYIYCDEDIWICGDALVMNQNPDKRIMVKVLCTKAKRDCICYTEDSNQFLSYCPNCGKWAIMIKNTPFKCEGCKFKITYKKVNLMPFAKLPCELCPRYIGWEKFQKLSAITKQRMQPRAAAVALKMENTDLSEVLSGVEEEGDG
jgi:hypothetical protein